MLKSEKINLINHGCARPDAGRKATDTKESKTKLTGRPRKTPEGFKRVTVSLPLKMVDDFKKLGGSAWLQEQIRKNSKK